MKTKGFAEQVANLPEKQKMAIIDLKVEHDREKVLQKLDAIKAEMKSEMGKLKGVGTKISVLYWLIGTLSMPISINKFLGYPSGCFFVMPACRTGRIFDTKTHVSRAPEPFMVTNRGIIISPWNDVCRVFFAVRFFAVL